jgi:hypothetical protein
LEKNTSVILKRIFMSTLNEQPSEESKKLTDKLRPCPLCGGLPGKEVFFCGIVRPGQYEVKCINCSLSTVHDRIDKVIGIWNNRAEESKSYFEGKPNFNVLASDYALSLGLNALRYEEMNFKAFKAGMDKIWTDYVEPERQRILKAEQERAEIKHAISELLAVMHGDGGHYESKYGTLKALQDAQELLFDKWKAQSQVEDFAIGFDKWKEEQGYLRALSTEPLYLKRSGGSARKSLTQLLDEYKEYLKKQN